LGHFPKEDMHLMRWHKEERTATKSLLKIQMEEQAVAELQGRGKGSVRLVREQ